MKRSDSKTSMMRARPVTEGLGRTRLVGKVVLVEATEPQSGVLRAHRYAREGADIAIVYLEPCDELFTVQRQIEALGNRCVLYEISLDDEWNCGLVVQSTNECLGGIDLVINGHGHVHVADGERPLTARQLRDIAIGSPAARTNSAA